ncbi:hypothetical protein JXB27_04230 [Candidatus Woesearchaeota archaeon]|nr:hypothetical protein [Candidatus Woesearchaeota archaeon]
MTEAAERPLDAERSRCMVLEPILERIVSEVEVSLPFRKGMEDIECQLVVGIWYDSLKEKLIEFKTANGTKPVVAKEIVEIYDSFAKEYNLYFAGQEKFVRLEESQNMFRRELPAQLKITPGYHNPIELNRGG